jgi:hypothetical protein
MRAEKDLPTRVVNPPEWRSIAARGLDQATAEHSTPSARVNSMPPTVTPPDCPLFALSNRGTAEFQAATRRAAGRDCIAPPEAHTLRGEVVPVSFELFPCEDRKLADAIKCSQVTWINTEFLKTLPVERHPRYGILHEVSNAAIAKESELLVAPSGA